MRKIVLLIFIILIILGGGMLWLQKHKVQQDGSVVPLVDSTGTVVQVPVQPKRIIFLNASNLEIFTAVGGKAVGKTTSTSYPEDILPLIKDIPEIGMIHSPNVEQILGLKPDLLIGVNVPFHVMLRKPMEMAGVPLYINMINSYEDVLKTIDLFGQFAGKPNEAAAKRAKIEADYAKLTSDVVTGHGPRTLIIFGSPDSFNMATEKSFVGDLLQRLGGINIADGESKAKDSSYIPLSMEYITKADPELILVITMGDGQTVMDKLRSELDINSVWKDVQAVKNKHVYQLPGNLFTVNPGTHIIEAMKQLRGYLKEASDGK